jgi:hypothetical protein
VGREEGARVVDELRELHDISMDPILAIGTVKGRRETEGAALAV